MHRERLRPGAPLLVRPGVQRPLATVRRSQGRLHARRGRVHPLRHGSIHALGAAPGGIAHGDPQGPTRQRPHLLERVGVVDDARGAGPVRYEEQVKLGDPNHGLKETELERVRLTGQSLADYGAFWDESALADTIKAIADSDDAASFETSGVTDAQAILALAPPDAVVLEIGSGVGRIMQHLSGACSEVHGVDISAEMVDRGA